MSIFGNAWDAEWLLSTGGMLVTPQLQELHARTCAALARLPHCVAPPAKYPTPGVAWEANAVTGPRLWVEARARVVTNPLSELLHARLVALEAAVGVASILPLGADAVIVADAEWARWHALLPSHLACFGSLLLNVLHVRLATVEWCIAESDRRHRAAEEEAARVAAAASAAEADAMATAAAAEEEAPTTPSVAARRGGALERTPPKRGCGASAELRYSDIEGRPDKKRKFSATFITTIGIDFRAKILTLTPPREVGDDKAPSSSQRVQLQLWDTAGQERFRTITTSYYRNTHAILLVYDVSQRDSFAQVTKWAEDVRREAGASVPIVLVGNKVDVDKSDPAARVVTTAEGVALAAKLKVPFYEVSAKSGAGVEAAFAELARVGMARAMARRVTPPRGGGGPGLVVDGVTDDAAAQGQPGGRGYGSCCCT